MGVACRGCGKSDLPVVLSLGSTPLANALRSASELDVPDPRYPLDVALCPACALVQLVETVDPAVLFADYAYLSSFSDTMLRHAQAYAERVLQSRALGANALVVEIGSNDGYLLRHFRQAGVAVLGIDPARAAAAAAERVGVPTRTAFFGRALADQLVGEGIRADVIVANNVMAHVPEINDVVTGVVRPPPTRTR